MTAEEILSISKCGDLFPYGINNVRNKYKELVKEWHPDSNSDIKAVDVFQKITELYKKALKLLEEGSWEKTNYILINKDKGKKILLNYDTTFDFELGKCYVTKTKVVYILDSDKKKYFDNAVFRIKSLKYADKNMEDILKRCMPEIYQTFKTNSGEYGIVFNKTPDVFPLKNILKYFNNKISDRHVAWILSRLYNISCFLRYNGIIHNGINVDNCFISPQYHSIILIGGWWYTTKEKERMLGTTKDIFSIMPVTSKSSKRSDFLTDLESIKLLGRQLLGEANCRKLVLNNSIPKPFINFLITGSTNDAYKEFEKWDKTLSNSYGERKFVKMKVDNPY